jgi:hypothetical protein
MKHKAILIPLFIVATALLASFLFTWRWCKFLAETQA